MSWVDLFILAVIVLAGLRGWVAGALRQIGGLVGFIVGFLLGVQFAPALATRITQSAWRPGIAIGLILGFAFVVSSLGHVGGAAVSRALHAVKLGLVDRLGGVVVGVIGSLLLCWMVAGLLASTAWGSLASGIQNSAVLKFLDTTLPPVPAVEARVQALFRGVDFPNVFATLISPTPPSTGPVTLGPLEPDLAAPTSVVKILTGGGCSVNHEGTGFFVAPHEVVTNAHVVAGAHAVTAGGSLARVVLFDPLQDLAVLRVPDLSEAPLGIDNQVPAPGTPARVVGFPLDGTRTGAPAVVRGDVSGQARDIYNRQLYTRTLEVVSVNVQPGNSGSPLLVRGRVAGVIVSKSLSEAQTAYAIPVSVLRADLAHVASSPVSTQACAP
ncbi:MAG: MarP family serine protease [Acidobacteriota bacterium]|nr:MarP family serine protease [Acidobacteriota bacterium]